MENTPISVSDCIALVNQTLDYAFPTLVIEGEVSSFSVNKNKFVFFDLKDDTGTLNCFMMVFQLKTQLEDGMRVRVVATPKLTQWGRFSLTVRDVRPVGEGSLRRAFDLLQAKLTKEGLFAESRKRLLPELPQKIAVISSTGAAGYADFIKILSERWGGLDIEVANTQVQGVDAGAQIVRAIEHFNQQPEPADVLVIVRGGGSADDLSTFNEEPLVRAIASSRIPTLVGVGHEVDVTLSDLAADKRAATPSNAAQVLVLDKNDLIRQIDRDTKQLLEVMQRQVVDQRREVTEAMTSALHRIDASFERSKQQLHQLQAVLTQLNPRMALKRGYALVFSEGKPLGTTKPKAGQTLSVETMRYIMKVGVQDVKAK